MWILWPNRVYVRPKLLTDNFTCHACRKIIYGPISWIYVQNTPTDAKTTCEKCKERGEIYE